MKSTIWAVIAALYLIDGGIVASAAFQPSPSAPTPPVPSLAAVAMTTSITLVQSSTAPSSAGTTVTLDGELVCLPHRAGGQEALTLECAIGLRTNEGRHYALDHINPYIVEGKIAMGQHIRVTGRLRTDTQTKYDATGTIAVTSVSKLDQH
ncbi:MAG TPA: hypothetical protein VNP04_01710 [Alphaproteobacteria bacterium]|nr:hypothetical protein [Alphaproteobacteria bacterium]